MVLEFGDSFESEYSEEEVKETNLIDPITRIETWLNDKGVQTNIEPKDKQRKSIILQKTSYSLNLSTSSVFKRRQDSGLLNNEDKKESSQNEDMDPLSPLKKNPVSMILIN